MLVFIATTLLAATAEPVCPGARPIDRPVIKIANRCVAAVQPAVRLRLGNLPRGTLYSFSGAVDRDFTSWLFVDGKKYVLHSPDPDEVAWFGLTSVFNVKRSNGYCIVLLRASGPNYLGDHSNDGPPDYSGLVYCLERGRVVLDQRLSKSLTGKANAAAARKALAPLL